MPDDHPIDEERPTTDPTDLVVVNGRAVHVPPAPPGWRVQSAPYDPRGYVYRPDPDHELYPANAALRERPRYAHWLATDPEISDYIQRNRQRLLDFAVEVVRQCAAEPSAQTRETITTAAAALATEIIDAVGRGLGRRDLPRWLVADHVVRQVFPSAIVAELVRPRLGVALFATSNGAINLVFTDASANHRAVWEPLIRSFQASFAFRKDEGGRGTEGFADLAAVIRAMHDDPGKPKPTMAAVGKAVFPHARKPEDSVYQRVATLKKQGVVRDWKDVIRRSLDELPA